MHPKKIKICAIAFCLFIIIFLSSSVSAYQKKMAVKDCIFSYNDEDFNNWDESAQTGIFLKITNNNLVLGETQNPSYEYTVYQPARTYYNNFEYGGTSTIPYLIVRASNEENKVYTKCNYKVGDYRIFFVTFYHNFGSHCAYLTHDFNLTQNIVTESMTGYSYSSLSQYNNTPSSYSRYSGASSQVRTDGIFYIDNKVDSEHSSSTLYNNGFYPNTEPTVTTVMNLDNFASSIFYAYSLIRENGHQSLFSSFGNWFYIDSDMQDAKNMLKPRAISQTFKNENTGKSPYFVANSGNKISAAFTFKNDFGIPLNNIRITRGIYSELMWTGGVGSAGTDIHGFDSRKTDYVDFLPGEEKTIYYDMIIPEGGVFPHLRGRRYVYGDSPYSSHAPSWPPIGSDEVDYLGFLRFDPRIQLEKTPEGIYQPVFNMTTELLVATSYAYTPVIKPSDYALLAELYLNGEKIDNFTIILDDAEFAKMGKTELTEGSTTEHTIIIPIKNEYKEEGGQCYIELYSVKLTEPFKDKKIASIVKSPYFKAGDIAYSYDDTLNFGIGSQIDSEKIVIFNPSFYENDIDLTIGSWSDENNFMLSWDGNSFSKNPSQTIHLYPLQSKEITFWINATYDPWVASSILENLKINTQANLKTDDGIITKNKDLDFILDVDKDALNWFNINPVRFDPEIIFLDNLNSTKNEEITLSWNIEGSDSAWEELAGNSYEVEIKLINGSNPDGEVLKETTAIFYISEDEVTKLTFDFDFSYGEYLVVLDLDSNNQIAEILSSGDSGEEDNYNLFQIPFLVTHCYYSEDDGYMHRINFFGEDVIDKENKCECPSPFITIPDEGYCADPYSEICSTFNLYSICNDWSQSKSGLCGWDCDGTSCPPSSVDDGTCLNCSIIPNTCSGYNNEETCEIDPCYKALLYDCVAFSCDTSQEYGCVWDDTFNQCNFKSTIDGKSCSYFGNIIGECNETNDKIIVNYTSDDIGCDDRIRETMCGHDTVLLNFFSKLSLIFAILTIIFFYIIENKKVKKQLQKNISKIISLKI